MALFIEGDFVTKCAVTGTTWVYNGVVGYSVDLGAPSSLSTKVSFEFLQSIFGTTTLSWSASAGSPSPPASAALTMASNLGYSPTFTLSQGQALNFSATGTLSSGADEYDFIVTAVSSNLFLSASTMGTTVGNRATATGMTQSGTPDGTNVYKWSPLSSYLTADKAGQSIGNATYGFSLYGDSGTAFRGTTANAMGKLWGQQFTNIIGSADIIHCFVVNFQNNPYTADASINISPTAFIAATAWNNAFTAINPVPSKRCSSLTRFADGIVDESEPGALMFDQSSLKRVEPSLIIHGSTSSNANDVPRAYVASLNTPITGTYISVIVALAPYNVNVINNIGVHFNAWSGTGDKYKTFAHGSSIAVSPVATPTDTVSLSGSLSGNGGAAVTAGYQWSWTGTAAALGTGLVSVWIKFFFDYMLKPTSVLLTYTSSDGAIKTTSIDSYTNTISLPAILGGTTYTIYARGIAADPPSAGASYRMRMFVGGSKDVSTRAVPYLIDKSIVINKAPTPPTVSFTATPATIGVNGTVTINPAASVAGLQSNGSPDPIAKWVYSYGDGSAVVTAGVGLTVTHTYFKAGVYTVTLSLVSTGLLMSSFSTQITVTKGLPAAPPVPPEGVASLPISYVPIDKDFPAFQIRRGPRA